MYCWHFKTWTVQLWQSVTIKVHGCIQSPLWHALQTCHDRHVIDKLQTIHYLLSIAVFPHLKKLVTVETVFSELSCTASVLV